MKLNCENIPIDNWNKSRRFQEGILSLNTILKTAFAASPRHNMGKKRLAAVDDRSSKWIIVSRTMTLENPLLSEAHVCVLGYAIDRSFFWLFILRIHWKGIATSHSCHIYICAMYFGYNRIMNALNFSFYQVTHWRHTHTTNLVYQCVYLHT